MAVVFCCTATNHTLRTQWSRTPSVAACLNDRLLLKCLLLCVKRKTSTNRRAFLLSPPGVKQHTRWCNVWQKVSLPCIVPSVCCVCIRLCGCCWFVAQIKYFTLRWPFHLSARFLFLLTCVVKTGLCNINLQYYREVLFIFLLESRNDWGWGLSPLPMIRGCEVVDLGHEGVQHRWTIVQNSCIYNGDSCWVLSTYISTLIRNSHPLVVPVIIVGIVVIAERDC